MSKNKNVGSLSLSTTVVTRFLSLCAVLLAVSLPAPAIAADVVLQPNQGPVGTGVTATGTGWSPGTGVLIYFESQLIGGPVTTDASGAFTTTFCVPQRSPGPYPVFFTNGSENFAPPFTITAGTPVNCQATPNCADAYLIGLHGYGEGPDSTQPERSVSIIVRETWKNFRDLATEAGKKVKRHYIDYPTPSLLDLGVATFIDRTYGAADIGVKKLGEHIREKLLKECENPKIVLVGYSIGAWVIDEWLSREENKDLMGYIKAVELYGDILWRREGPLYLGAPKDTYEGVLRRLGLSSDRDPYKNLPQGPGGELTERWQSRCLKDDALCGEGWGSFLLNLGNQIGAASRCGFALCEHQRYPINPGPGDHPVPTATCGNPLLEGLTSTGYGLTRCGAKFLALKTFPKGTAEPEIVHYETFVEGDFVYIRLYYTGSPTGFGFVGVNGAGWARAEIPFSNIPYPISTWIRVSPNGDRVDYPFNHLCSTAPDNASDIETWVYKDGSTPRESIHVGIHLACSAPKEVVTPFFDR